MPLGITEEMARSGKRLSPKLDYAPVEMTGDTYDVAGGKPRLEPGLVRASLDALQKYATFVRSRDARLLVVALEDDERTVHIENETIREFCLRNNIPFKRFAMPDALKLNAEGHLNKLGNHRLAEKVFGWIEQQRQPNERPADRQGVGPESAATR
jgi:hypothetical protein